MLYEVRKSARYRFGRVWSGDYQRQWSTSGDCRGSTARSRTPATDAA